MRKSRWIAVLLCMGLILAMMPAAVFAGTAGGVDTGGSKAAYKGTYDEASGVLKLVLSFQSPDIGVKGVAGLLKIDQEVLLPCNASGAVTELDSSNTKKQSLKGCVEAISGLMVAGQYGFFSGGELYVQMEIGGATSIDCKASANVATLYFKVADESKLNYKSIQLPEDTAVLDQIVTTKKGAVLQLNSTLDKAIAYVPQTSWASGLGGKITGYTFASAPELTYRGSERKPSLGGSVTLASNAAPAKMGSVLTAAVSGTETTEDLIYTWKRDAETISEAAGTTYTAAEADKGKEISVSVGHANYSAITSNAILICDVPGAPASVNAEIAAENTLRFTWTAPADNGGTVLTGYELAVTDVTDPANPKSAGTFSDLSADTLEKTVEGLTDGHKYQAAVRAKNAVDFGAAKELDAPITMVNAVGAAEPVFTTNLTTTPMDKAYGDTVELTVAADVADPTAEAAKGDYEITYQWYEAEDASGTGAKAMEGAAQPVLKMKAAVGTGYYYCVANNYNDLTKVEGKKGETDAKTQSAAATVATVEKNLDTAGITVNKTASIYKSDKLDLSHLLTMKAAAGAIEGETVTQVLNLANDKVSEGAIVVFKKSGAAATAAAIAYADVIKTAGTYDYTVNIPQKGSSTNYSLKGAIVGEGTLTVKTKSSGGGGGGGGSSSGGSATTTTGTEVKKDLPSNGQVSIGASDVKNAKSIEVKNSEIIVNLNQQAVSALDKTTGLVIKTEKKSSVALNEMAKQLLGSRPVFDITATQNGKAVTKFGSGKITISVAYTPASGEDTGKLGLYYINDQGEPEKVSGSKYDATLKAVTGQTSHLSSYAVGYDKNAADTATPGTPAASKGLFRDVSSSDWFYTAVMDLAGKEIISGIPDEDAKGNPIGTYTFRPQANVTRAEFVTMLAKAAGADLSQYSTKVFNDVNLNDWYAKAAAWGSSVGVASGTGDGNFSPNANITRQDMAVMVNKYVANAAKTTLTAKNKKAAFTDTAQIADYASGAVETMQTAGILSGAPNEDAKGNPIGTYQFRPFANATRAEAVSMLNGLLTALQ